MFKWVVARLLLLAGLAAGIVYGVKAMPDSSGLVVEQLRLTWPYVKEAWVAAATVAIFSSLSTLLVAQVFFEWWYRRRTIRIIFPPQANLDSVQSLFKRSMTPVVNGKPEPSMISVHQFFLGVQNTGYTTVKNVRLTVLGLNKPSQVLQFSLTPENDTGAGCADIRPGQIEYFQLLEGCDRRVISLRVMEPDAYAALMTRIAQREHVGAELTGHRASRLPLLKNDGYWIDVAAFGDDVPCDRRLVLLNTRSNLEMFLFRSKLHARSRFALEKASKRLKETTWRLAKASR